MRQGRWAKEAFDPPVMVYGAYWKEQATANRGLAGGQQYTCTGITGLLRHSGASRPDVISSLASTWLSFPFPSLYSAPSSHSIRYTLPQRTLTHVLHSYTEYLLLDYRDIAMRRFGN